MDKSISIAMTTYNGEKFVDLQIQSLLHQSRPFDELIICDDNSDDNTYSILEHYANNDYRIKIYRNEKNLGFKKNFEKAILLAKGDYIALCDQDDVWSENHLESLLKGIGNNMVVCGDALINSTDKRNGLKLSYLMHQCNTEKDNKNILNFALIYQNTFLGMSMMIKNTFVKYALPIPTNAHFHDSWFAFLAIAMNSFVWIPQVITHYRLHTGNVTGGYERHSYFRSILSHLLKGHRKSDRLDVIIEIRNRLQLEDKMAKEIEHLNKYFINDNKLLGRLKNFYFELKNYNRIYK